MQHRKHPSTSREAKRTTLCSVRRVSHVSTGGCEGRELVEELGVFLLAAHSRHRANFERKVPDQLPCGQLVNLQNILDVVEIVDQQVALVDAGGKTCR